MSAMLVPCVHCARHVRSDAARCPFCDVAGCAPAVSESLDAVHRNLSRAAIIALGTTLALSNCRPSPSVGGHDEHVTIMQPYGVPIPPPHDAPMPAIDVPPIPDVAALRVAAEPEVSWALTATPTNVSMGERARWRITLDATNHGTRAVDARRHRLTFTVNGAASIVMDLAFSNGARGPEWTALAPGATAHDARALGPSLFTAPGRYDITLHCDGAPVSTLHVRVRSD